MGKRIELPAQPSGNATDQLQKMYSYLYQVATTINANLDEIGGMEFTDEEMRIVNKILNPDDAEEGTPSYNYKEAETLKSLIIKTANFVQQSLQEYRLNLLGEYVAEGKFGKYVRKTGLDVEVTPEHIMQSYQLQEIIQGLKVYEINAKNYIKTGLLRTEQMLPVYGVAIGKDIVTFTEDGTETYNDGNKVAELTADSLSFWQGGNMIAKYTGGRISFYYGSTEAFYIQNGKIYAAGDLEIVTGKKLIISTETFSIDGSGNVVLKGDVEIKSGKSLAIKSGGTFTVDSGNFSIDAQGNATFKGGGEFSGELKAASGTFAGELSAATGTFAGSLSAATGTFAGTMSAACVTSGTMSCERISGGNLTLGGDNNTNGALVIKNASGTVIGRWDKDGISATTGSFAGSLNGATGTFAGSLSAATGTFAGSLSAATGTFAGTMSAACVTSGTMSCERISGGNLTLGGNNNASGKLVIKNASGTIIGTWDKDGINATTGTFSGSLNGATGTFAGSLSAATGTFAGELSAATGTFAGTMSAACVTSGTMSCERISGGTLTLGGSNNTNGKLVIKDANGTVIGTWDKDGINATTGTFSGSLSGATGTFAGSLSAATGTFAGTMSAACVTSGTMSCERLSGGTLTLGGNNNTNGRLIIKNGSGTTVGTWDKDGIVIGTGGSFTVQSGSAFTVYTDNMDVDSTGMTIKSGVIKGKHYTEDGVPLLAGNDVVVASTAPTGAPGRIWLKPLDSVGVNYSKNISAVTNVNGFSSTLTTSGQTAGAGSNNSYRLRMLIRAETSSGSGIDVTITVASALTFTAHIPPGYYDSQGYHGDTELDLTITNANWYGNNSSLAIGISAVGTGGESGMVNYYKIPIGSIQLVATSAGSSGSGWKSCEIKVYQ